MIKYTYKVHYPRLRPTGEAYDFCAKITGKATLNYTFTYAIIYNLNTPYKQYTGIKSQNQNIYYSRKGG